MRLEDKVALVTGAAKGIGRGIARRFAAEGAVVIVADIDEAAGAETARRIQSEGGRAVFQKCDVGRRDQVRAAVARAVEAFGGLDIAIANAGIAIRGDFLAFDEADFDQVLQTNLYGAWYTFQEAGRQMRAQGRGGSMVAISSVNGLVAMPHVVANCVAKGGMNQLVKTAALGLADDGVRVNALAPGSVDAGMVYDVNHKDTAAWRALEARTPMRRMGTVDEIAAITAFLASDDASYMTGEIVVADGGRLAMNYTMPPLD